MVPMDLLDVSDVRGKNRYTSSGYSTTLHVVIVAGGTTGRLAVCLCGGGGGGGA